MKRRNIIFGVILILFITIIIFIIKNDNCNTRCLSKGYTSGECLSGGSALENIDVCGNIGTVEITNRKDPIPGCDFESIGSGDACCCFK